MIIMVSCSFQQPQALLWLKELTSYEEVERKKVNKQSSREEAHVRSHMSHIVKHKQSQCGAPACKSVCECALHGKNQKIRKICFY